jgi:hypothetical protein
MRCTPLFLKAVPQSIGWISVAIVRVRMPSLISSSVRSPVFEVLVHQLFARLGRGFDHVLAPLLRVGQHVGRDVAVVELHALRGLVPDDRLHLDQVDHAGEAVLGTDRDHDRHRVRLQANLHLVETLKKFAPVRSILLTNARRGTLYLLAWRQTVSDCGCTPPDRAIDHAGAVEHAHAALDLDREVDVPRGCR